ncbi:hypothetical protein VTN77DRAFT_8759 [Rasamsonia byssochlamydoides]|uniref:uncharacterized protein n=1 Tax=Rasamsonia byssochlamydoides TaxID=89139 RepID=UPI0037446BDF
MIQLSLPSHAYPPSTDGLFELPSPQAPGAMAPFPAPRPACPAISPVSTRRSHQLPMCTPCRDASDTSRGSCSSCSQIRLLDRWPIQRTRFGSASTSFSFSFTLLSFFLLLLLTGPFCRRPIYCLSILFILLRKAPTYLNVKKELIYFRIISYLLLSHLLIRVQIDIKLAHLAAGGELVLWI